MKLRIYIVIMFLACMVASLGWLTTRFNLAAAQVKGESLATENKEYAYSLEEIRWLAGIANKQVTMTNQQIELANASIEKLKQKLTESEKLSAYWYGRANPREFESLDALKAWLAKDNTDKAVYIFGSGCLTGYDCNDYAVALVRNALLDGYLISFQVQGNHMLNSTIIGNKIYFIEPQTDEVWFYGYRG
jgi:hypothetical protein